MVVSLAIHAVIIVVAILVVVAKVIIPEDPDFQVKKVKRPKMPPKKIQVPVDVKKRKPKPRLRKRIVVNKKTLADIKMPEISGIRGGLGNMGGDGIGGLGFDLKMDLFGSNRSMGDELTGTFYDLKQTKDGKPTGMTNERYIEEVRKFASSFKSNRFKDYFKAPQEKYASFFMIPSMSANAAPKAYGVDNVVKPKHWVAFYEGHFAAQEAGHYRFCGFADDILLVEVRGRLVLDASHQAWRKKVTSWESDDDNNRQWPISGQKMVIGDWFRLEKNTPTRIELLFGECPGGIFSCQLMIEQRGKEYRQVAVDGGTRPVLPVFKTKDIPREMHGKMRFNSNEATLDGPSFGAAEK